MKATILSLRCLYPPVVTLKNCMRHGEVWIGLQAVLLLLWRARTYGLRPDFSHGDLEDYLRLAQGPLLSRAALSSIKTLGYPAILQFSSLLSAGYRAVPYVQFSFIVLAALAVYY